MSYQFTIQRYIVLHIASYTFGQLNYLSLQSNTCSQYVQFIFNGTAT